MMAGDFNVIADPVESSNSADTFVTNTDIREFMDCCIRLSMFDHVSTGPTFTWTNKHLDGFITKKLDRVLINDAWLAQFTHSTMEFLALEVSDHCPSLIQLEEVIHFPPRPFKFFNF